jgi:hypothetical protein
MIVKSLEGLDLTAFERIIITIVKPHDEKYEVRLFLDQVFGKGVEVCLLNDFTSSASETVALTLRKMGVKGPFVVKDSDNYVKVAIVASHGNFITGYSLIAHPEIDNVAGKSFLVVSDQDVVRDIVEKRIVSDTICLGVYAFADAMEFLAAYDGLGSQASGAGEMYISHVISYMLFKRGAVFTVVMAKGYEDWGTWPQWRAVALRMKTYFVDFDGVIMKNSGRYGSVNWSNNIAFLDDNVKVLRELQDAGSQIVITTSRPEEFRPALETLLMSTGLRPYAVVMGLNHSPRVLVNDFAPTNPYPSAAAVSLPRNTYIRDWIEK